MKTFESVVAYLVEQCSKEQLQCELILQESINTTGEQFGTNSDRVTYLNQLASEEDVLKALKSALMIIYMEENDEASALNMLQSGAGTNFYYHDHKPIHHAALFKMQKVIKALLDSGIQIEDDSCIISILQENDDDRDSWREIVDMLVENLFKLPDAVATSSLVSKLIKWKCKSATEVMKRISTWKIDYHSFEDTDFFYTDIFTCEHDCFKIFLKKFGKLLLDFNANEEWWLVNAIGRAYNSKSNDESNTLKNINHLMDWEHSNEIVQTVNDSTEKNSISFCDLLIISDQVVPQMTSEQMYELLECVTKAGIKITAEDMDFLYIDYGYNSVFKQLLLKPIKLDVPIFYGTFSAFYYDLSWNIARLSSSIEDNSNFLSPKFGHLFFYFAHPAIKKCAKRSTNSYLRELAENSADFPKLVELARNVCRKNIKTYSVQDTAQFYKLIGNLPIANVYKEILLLERSLY